MEKGIFLYWTINEYVTLKTTLHFQRTCTYTYIHSTECVVEAVEISCLKHNNSQFDDKNFLQIHGTAAMGPKKAYSYADIAMGVIDNKAKSGTIKPNIWLRYQDDIFDLWLQGKTKLLFQRSPKFASSNH